VEDCAWQLRLQVECKVCYRNQWGIDAVFWVKFGVMQTINQ